MHELPKMPEDQNLAPQAGPKPSAADPAHTESGAPTDQAHRDAGDGTLVGSVPAGLSLKEMKKMAEEDQPTESGTG